MGPIDDNKYHMTQLNVPPYSWAKRYLLSKPFRVVYIFLRQIIRSFLSRAGTHPEDTPTGTIIIVAAL